MQKFFISSEGAYIGSYDGPEELTPADMVGAEEVSSPPEDGRQIWSNGQWLPLSSPVPHEISDRQFFQQMAHEDRISEEEALDAVGAGIIPPAMDTLVEQLPKDKRFAARMLIRGATTFRRDHPVTALIGQLYGMSSDQIDETWRAAALL